jgi:hypothetical protein
MALRLIAAMNGSEPDSSDSSRRAVGVGDPVAVIAPSSANGRFVFVSDAAVWTTAWRATTSMSLVVCLRSPTVRMGGTPSREES